MDIEFFRNLAPGLHIIEDPTNNKVRLMVKGAGEYYIRNNQLPYVPIFICKKKFDKCNLDREIGELEFEASVNYLGTYFVTDFDPSKYKYIKRY